MCYQTYTKIIQQKAFGDDYKPILKTLTVSKCVDVRSFELPKRGSLKQITLFLKHNEAISASIKLKSNSEDFGNDFDM